jgi:hypothetical protein
MQRRPAGDCNPFDQISNCEGKDNKSGTDRKKRSASALLSASTSSTEPSKDVSSQRQKLSLKFKEKMADNNRDRTVRFEDSPPPPSFLRHRDEIMAPHPNDFDVEQKHPEVEEMKTSEEDGDVTSKAWFERREHFKDFPHWFSTSFGSFPVLQEGVQYKTCADGELFNCLRLPKEQGEIICLVRHAKIHTSLLGWIESCSVAKLDLGDGFIGPGTYAGPFERIAIKVFDLERIYKTDLQENAYGELMIHAKLTQLCHKNICPLLGCYRTNKKVFAIYPMYEGGDAFEQLATLETKNLKLEEDQVKPFMIGAIEAVAACHMAGFVHRDVSLENFVLPARASLRNPVIIDFGVSARLGPDGLVAHTGPVGKAKYCAPELYVDPQHLPRYDGKRADVFSLGVVMLILIICMEPWDSTSSVDPRFSRMILRGDLGLVLKVWGYSPSPALVDLLSKMMHPDPAERPTIREVLEHPWFR